ncbi:MAG: Ig-like domain-containing protein [Ferruginibacter sp.]
MRKNIFVLLGSIIGCYLLATFGSGCAQVGAPTGGPKDTIAPVLVRANPEPGKINFTGNKITIVFDEYIELKDIQSNLVVSPLPKKNPSISSSLKTISIKLKDTLQPNTTYSINFGNAVVDVHEGNILKDFTYSFSTGSFIDSLEFKGKVFLAETGKVDSTLLVYLYKNAVDSDITTRRPDYITKINGKGNFTFKHLPAATFKIYVLKDADGGKTYNSKTETFAFTDADIYTAEHVEPVTLFAYAEEKEAPRALPSPKKPLEKKLKYTASLTGKTQDILQPLTFEFSNGLKKYDSSKIIVSDTNFKPLPNIVPILDSNRKKITINIPWKTETFYYFIMPKESFEDSAGNALDKTDTVRFSTKRTSDYGRIVLRFKNIDLAKHPVIQFLQNDAIKFSFPVTSAEWSNKLFPPGEYDVRILYDTNNNGVWDPGNYKEKLQPERAISLPQKLGIKADWDNEREIQL